MESFIEFLKLPNSWSVVIALIFFSLPMAAAYTIFISKDLWKVKPKWLFYVLFPTLILLFKLLEINTAIIIIVLFPLLFLLSLLGSVVAFILDLRKSLKEEKLKDILIGLAKTLLFLGLLVLSWLYFGPVTILFIIAYTFVSGMIFPSEKNRFLNIQATLPTSKLDSMAMGLVEVKGQTVMQNPMLSPIDKKKCIGYRLVIEKVRHDDNGNTSYTTISDEVFCNDFIIKDKTGEARVKADGINFIWLEADKHRSRASKRYTQYLLLDHQDILLIGKANAGVEGPFIEKESIKDIFALAPYNKVTRWNVNKPLLNSFMTYLVMLFVLIALILMSEITVTDDLVIFNLGFDNFSLNNLFK